MKLKSYINRVLSFFLKKEKVNRSGPVHHLKLQPSTVEYYHLKLMAMLCF